jgi:hypothetical protein
LKFGLDHKKQVFKCKRVILSELLIFQENFTKNNQTKISPSAKF